MPETRQTVVCRNKKCKGGGWWGDSIPILCPHCNFLLIYLPEVVIIDLKEE